MRSSPPPPLPLPSHPTHPSPSPARIRPPYPPPGSHTCCTGDARRLPGGQVIGPRGAHGAARGNGKGVPTQWARGAGDRSPRGVGARHALNARHCSGGVGVRASRAGGTRGAVAWGELAGHARHTVRAIIAGAAHAGGGVGVGHLALVAVVAGVGAPGAVPTQWARGAVGRCSALPHKSTEGSTCTRCPSKNLCRVLIHAAKGPLNGRQPSLPPFILKLSPRPVTCLGLASPPPPPDTHPHPHPQRRAPAPTLLYVPPGHRVHAAAPASE